MNNDSDNLEERSTHEDAQSVDQKDEFQKA